MKGTKIADDIYDTLLRTFLAQLLMTIEFAGGFKGVTVMVDPDG